MAWKQADAYIVSVRYFALAVDYDGTIATGGVVDDGTIAALERLKQSARKILLVTGRELADLLQIFPRIQLFDSVVAENGAVRYDPAARQEELLAKPAPEHFVRALQCRGVTPLSVGKSIVATTEPNQHAVLETIHDLGLELQVIFNKGAVMVLESGVNKASGLHAALSQLKLSSHNVVGVGDAENDHAFLSGCECAAAVANGLPSLRDLVDVVTSHENGSGVVELIESILADDLIEIEPKLSRHYLAIGETEDGMAASLRPYGENVLLVGASGGGKSTLATRFMEELMSHRYQAVIVDPEGDYANLHAAAVLGAAHAAPDPDEVLRLLEQPDQQVVVSMVGLSRDQRPAYLEQLLPRLLEIKGRLGHPHWIIIDEAHHVLPESRMPATGIFPKGMSGLMFITVDPAHIAPVVVSLINVLLTIGDEPAEAIRQFTAVTGKSPPALGTENLKQGDAFLWRVNSAAPVRFRSSPPEIERQRHRRKYAKGELSPDASFYFKGPLGKMNLRVQNLMLFIQVAEGVDDETWLYHLNSGDYSSWFRRAIKDEELSDAVKAVEAEKGLTAAESRRRIKSLVEGRYTLSA